MQSYEAPELIEFGDVIDLTQWGGGTNTDQDGGSLPPQ